MNGKIFKGSDGESLPKTSKHFYNHKVNNSPYQNHFYYELLWKPWTRKWSKGKYIRHNWKGKILTVSTILLLVYICLHRKIVEPKRESWVSLLGRKINTQSRSHSDTNTNSTYTMAELKCSFCLQILGV